MTTKLIFFGSSEYSLPILQKLSQIPWIEISAVVTKPNKPFGRGQIITPNPVAQFALEHHLNLLQPNDFNSEFLLEIRNLSLDIALCVAYGPPFFTPEMISIPKYGIINIHPSPLPKYRGATPGPWQIINGEAKSAVSFFLIDEKPDHGPIITQIPFEISPTETSVSFYHKAFKIASDNLDAVIKSYILNPTSQPQDHTQKSYFPKFDKDSAQIDWSWQPIKIERFVRALIPWPVAWTNVADQKGSQIKMKIFSAHLENNKLIPDRVQLENKTKTNWSEIKAYYRII